MRIRILTAAVGALAVLGLSAGLAPAVSAQGTPSQQFTVKSDGQWVPTGITVTTGQVIRISAVGAWSPEGGLTVGPDGATRLWGDNFLNLTDIGTIGTTPTPHWAALVGYIGASPPAVGSYTNPAIKPEAAKVFFVGSQYAASAARNGQLWLNFNDDAYSGNTSDNSGQVQATVTAGGPAVNCGKSNQQREEHCYVAALKNFPDPKGARAYGIAGAFDVPGNLPLVGNNQSIAQMQINDATTGKETYGIEYGWNATTGQEQPHLFLILNDVNKRLPKEARCQIGVAPDAYPPPCPQPAAWVPTSTVQPGSPLAPGRVELRITQSFDGSWHVEYQNMLIGRIPDSWFGGAFTSGRGLGWQGEVVVIDLTHPPVMGSGIRPPCAGSATITGMQYATANTTFVPADAVLPAPTDGAYWDGLALTKGGVNGFAYGGPTRCAGS